ncbi:hypothetical protein BDQ17DRAFT_1437681 [Cyathus striatus]|nr:hypothetical protein BDQ17DRAFT_1437681 [Cyathus striatus]
MLHDVHLIQALTSLPEMPVFFQTRFIPILLALLSITKAAIINITVDDAYPDSLTGQFVNYLPRDLWNNGLTCRTCSANIDAEKMHDETWHESTRIKDFTESVAGGTPPPTYHEDDESED